MALRTPSTSLLLPYAAIPPMLQSLPSPDAARYDAFVVSGRRVYSVRAPRMAGGGGGFERGKGGVYIAGVGAGATAEELDCIQHRAEVQHVALQEQCGGGGGAAVRASVDCYGRAVLAHAPLHPHCHEGEGDGGSDSDGGGLQFMGVEQLQPTDVLR